ncbi:MAG: hypothetical protein NC211_03575 [Alistipes senegalensis]|nr:hypothetical protein [Oxalobacter formigenes]MCM1280898.1 hypothetical protein [Alistipes senegalensis]
MDTWLEMGGKMIPARVEFDVKGREEFRKFGGESALILDAIAAAPEVIASGEYAGRKVERDHLPQVAFHTKIKRVSTPSGKKLVAVDIGEDVKGKVHAYSVNMEGVSSFRKKLEWLIKNAEKRKSGLDSVLLPSSEDSAIFYTLDTVTRPLEDSLTGAFVPVKLEVIGIRILG